MKVVVLCAKAAMSKLSSAPAFVDTSDAGALTEAAETSACVCFIPSASLCRQAVLTEHKASNVEA